LGGERERFPAREREFDEEWLMIVDSVGKV
jgi:hypothetical protein